jgi:hypothetical protein
MKGILCGLILSLLSMQAANASAITGNGVFDVEFYDPETNEVLYTGTGHFTVSHDILTAFEFEMLGEKWVLADAISACCHVSNDEPLIFIEFANEAGAGYLTWRFDDSTFGFSLTVDDLTIFGNNEGTDGAASGVFRSQDFSVVPEPATLGLFALALIPIFTRKPRRSEPTCDRY